MKKSFGFRACSMLLAMGMGLASTYAAPLKPISKEPYVGSIAVDADTGQVILEHNPDSIAYPASVVKLMTLYVILEKVKAGELHFDDPVTITREASGIGEAQVYLKEGEVFPMEDLIFAMMLRSANDASAALAVHAAGSVEAFVEIMNKKANLLGMRSTLYRTVHGLPPDRNANPPIPPDITTARDVAKLSRALLSHPDTLRFTSVKNRNFRPGPAMQAMKNHNPLLADVPGCDGLKTGWFIKAGYSISATVKRNDRRIIVVVMGAKQRQVRDTSARTLIAKSFAMLPPLPPPPPPPPPKPATPPPPPPPEEPAIPGWAIGLGVVGILAVVWGISRMFIRRPSRHDF